MDDVSIRAIKSVSNELEGIGDGITDLVNIAKTEKKYYDETLGDKIHESLLRVLAKVSEVEAGKNYYHSELVTEIKTALQEVIGKLSNPRLDMSPIMKIAGDITSQNKEILNAILNAPKQETNDEKYQSLLEQTISLIAKNHEFFNMIAERMQQKPVIIEEKKEIKSWKFVHKIEYNRIVETEAIPKYKA